MLLGMAVLIAPRGSIVGKYRAWKVDRQMLQQVRTTWNTLVAGAGRLDDADGEVLIVTFSDYECSACRQAHDSVAAFLQAYPSAGIAYRHLPLSQHHMGLAAARAATCAAQAARFREMHEHLFASDRWMDGTTWIPEAKLVEVADTISFAACLRSSGTDLTLAGDQQLADQLGVRATPTFVSRRGVLVGLPSRESLRRLVAF